jgi:hypothetical protein
VLYYARLIECQDVGDIQRTARVVNDGCACRVNLQLVIAEILEQLYGTAGAVEPNLSFVADRILNVKRRPRLIHVDIARADDFHI